MATGLSLSTWVKAVLVNQALWSILRICDLSKIDLISDFILQGKIFENVGACG
jgi:hypothetical protein